MFESNIKTTKITINDISKSITFYKVKLLNITPQHCYYYYYDTYLFCDDTIPTTKYQWYCKYVTMLKYNL